MLETLVFIGTLICVYDNKNDWYNCQDSDTVREVNIILEQSEVEALLDDFNKQQNKPL